MEWLAQKVRESTDRWKSQQAAQRIGAKVSALLTQQETTMSGTSSDTLDGMTITQLRDLAQRAENAAKQQEQKAEDERYVYLPVTASGRMRRVRKSDCTVQSRLSSGWESIYHEIAPILADTGSGDLKVMAEIFIQVAEQKRQGALK